MGNENDIYKLYEYNHRRFCEDLDEDITTENSYVEVEESKLDVLGKNKLMYNIHNTDDANGLTYIVRGRLFHEDDAGVRTYSDWQDAITEGTLDAGEDANVILKDNQLKYVEYAVFLKSSVADTPATADVTGYSAVQRTKMSEVLAYPAEAELWVAPDGDDLASGSREHPMATPSKAVERLYAKHGPGVVKRVVIMPGEYIDAILINQPNTQVIGYSDMYLEDQDQISGAVVIKGSTELGPPLQITNMTKTAFQGFIDEASGAAFINADGTNYTYTGPDIVGRTQEDYGSFFVNAQTFDCVVQDIVFSQNGSSLNTLGTQEVGGLICFTDNFSTGNAFAGFGELRRCRFMNFQDIGLVIKNTYLGQLIDHEGDSAPDIGDLIVDNCAIIKMIGEARGGRVTNVHVRVDDTDQATEAASLLAGNGSLSFTYGGYLGKNVYCYSNPVDTHQILADSCPMLYITRDLYLNQNCALKEVFGGPTLLTLPDETYGRIYVRDQSELQAKTVICRQLNKSSTGDVDIGHLTALGECNFGGGGTVTIRGGTIGEDDTLTNVDVTGGTTLKLRNATIRGHLNVDGTSSIEFINVVVEGNVTFASGGGTVSWLSGAYHGTLSDVDSKLDESTLSGSGGGGAATGLEHGTQVLHLPLDDGIRPSSGQTTRSWNNDLAAIRFDHYGSPTSGDHGIQRMPAPQIYGYTGGDVTFRVYYSLASSGDVGDAAKFRLAVAQLNQGETLPADYDNKYITLVDLENITFDTLQYFEFVIPAADWDVTKEKIFLQLERMNSDAQDTFSAATEGEFDHRVYVHGYVLLWTGWGIEPQMAAP